MVYETNYCPERFMYAPMHERYPGISHALTNLNLGFELIAKSPKGPRAEVLEMLDDQEAHFAEQDMEYSDRISTAFYEVSESLIKRGITLISDENLDDAIGGKFSRKLSRISLKPNESPLTSLRVLVHEAAHLVSEEYDKLPITHKEAYVESATYVFLLARYGLNTHKLSLPYVMAYGYAESLLTNDPLTFPRITANTTLIASRLLQMLDGDKVITKTPVHDLFIDRLSKNLAYR